MATDRNNLGMAWGSLGEYKKAIGYYGQALAVLEQKLGIDHPYANKARTNLANAKAQLAQTETD